MSREAILRRVRDALTRQGRTGPHAARPSEWRTAAPPSQAATPNDAYAQFRAQTERKGTDVIAVAHWPDLPRAISDYLRGSATDTTSLRVSAEIPSGLAWRHAGLSFGTGPAVAGDSIGLSRAMAAVAETGTLVLASGPGNPVTLAFLPDVHLIAVARGAILPTFEDAARVLDQAYPNGQLPRSINFISGASRTGDIGGRIVKGAHGPRTLAVFVIDEALETKTTGRP